MLLEEGGSRWPTLSKPESTPPTMEHKANTRQTARILTPVTETFVTVILALLNYGFPLPCMYVLAMETVPTIVLKDSPDPRESRNPQSANPPTEILDQPGVHSRVRQPRTLMFANMRVVRAARGLFAAQCSERIDAGSAPCWTIAGKQGDAHQKSGNGAQR